MPFDYRTIMSGQRKDPLAALLRGALSVASLPYGVAVATRNRRFDRESSEIHRCGVPVISVGNLTTGGTGKTPIVCFLAKWFRSKGLRVAIVSRGYGRGEADANDEALELHDRLPDVPHVQDADRVEAARVAVEELGAEIILMDDGFQHRRLHRDLNLVVIDATCPFGFGHLLPRGLLREPISGLRRADAVIITRCDATNESAIQRIEETVQGITPSIPILHSTHTPTHLLTYPDRSAPIDDLSGQRVGLVSAIGNPDAFASTVKSCGANVVDSRQLPDHDEYSPETVAQLRSWSQSLADQMDQVICTHKDLVKLQTDRLGGVPLAAIIIELMMQSDVGPLEEKLQAIVGEVSGGS